MGGDLARFAKGRSRTVAEPTSPSMSLCGIPDPPGSRTTVRPQRPQGTRVWRRRDPQCPKALGDSHTGGGLTLEGALRGPGSPGAQEKLSRGVSRGSEHPQSLPCRLTRRGGAFALTAICRRPAGLGWGRGPRSPPRGASPLPRRDSRRPGPLSAYAADPGRLGHNHTAMPRKFSK